MVNTLCMIINNHSNKPANWHRWTCSTLTPARQVGTRFTCPRGMEGWVDFGGCLHTEILCLSTTNWVQPRATVLILHSVLTITLHRHQNVIQMNKWNSKVWNTSLVVCCWRVGSGDWKWRSRRSRLAAVQQDQQQLLHVRPRSSYAQSQVSVNFFQLSPWLIGTVRAEPETVISRAWVQSPDPAE